MKFLTPEEVLQLAEDAERRAKQANTMDFSGVFLEVEDWAEDAVTEAKPTPPKPKQYCETCGHVDSHAEDCPEAMEPEHAPTVRIDVKTAQKPEPIVPLLRRIGASAVRRVARKVEAIASRLDAPTRKGS